MPYWTTRSEGLSFRSLFKLSKEEEPFLCSTVPEERNFDFVRWAVGVRRVSTALERCVIAVLQRFAFRTVDADGSSEESAAIDSMPSESYVILFIFAIWARLMMLVNEFSSNQTVPRKGTSHTCLVTIGPPLVFITIVVGDSLMLVT